MSIISVIIPTLNEEGNLTCLIRRLREINSSNLLEIIIADGGSTDGTLDEAKQLNLKIVNCAKGCRAAQMNKGAGVAKGKVLYFVHADTLPPASYAHDINESMTKGFELGCYRFKFNANRFGLRVQAYFTRFDLIIFRGGDQTLFISKKIFDKIDGFNERFVLMEDYEILKRARKLTKFKIIKKDVLVSARKYEHNNYFKVNFANFVVFAMYFLNFSPQKLKSTYFNLLKHPKDIG